MIWKKIENRSLQLLEILERSSISEELLLEKLEISKKTLSNDVKQLNKKMQNCAFVNLKDKKLSLFVYDYNLYKRCVNIIKKEGESFNNEKYRLIYIIGYLFLNDTANMGDLSFEMMISKTTLNKDIEKLNNLIKDYRLKISGKPNVGIYLQGEEIDIRNFVIENCYYEIIKENKNTKIVSKIIKDILSPYLIDEDTIEKMKMFLNVSISRINKGHNIENLSDNYAYDSNKFSFDIANILRDKVSHMFEIVLSHEELKFITVPIRGMRTPLITNKISDIKIGDEIYDLIEEIFMAIKKRMDLEVDLGKVKKEFTYHIYFLLNRIKLDYKIQNSLNDEIKKEYRVAYKMAEIASKVIEDKLDKKINESEKSYLASYFQIYIVEKLDLINKNSFKIAIYTTDEINGQSLKRKLKSMSPGNDLSVSILDSIDLNLNSFDLIITNKDIDTDINQISGEEAYNFAIIKERIENLREKKNLVLNKRFLKSVFLNELNDQKLFLLDGEDFNQNLIYMLDSLENEGLISKDFKQKVIDREKKSSTIFSQSVAFPHAKANKLTVALGINEKSYPKLIFLVGLPENLDEILVKLYDEIVTIANDENLVDKISKIKSYPKLMEFFIKDTNLFR